MHFFKSHSVFPKQSPAHYSLGIEMIKYTALRTDTNTDLAEVSTPSDALITCLLCHLSFAAASFPYSTFLQ